MILSGAEADKEISKVQPADLEEASPDRFAYLRLGDEDFERLSYALAKSSAPQGVTRCWDGAALMITGADAGRDVLLTATGRAVGIIQCKRLESQMALPAVYREMAKLILFAQVNGDLSLAGRLTYILAVARDPARTVVDYFARRAEIELSKDDVIRAAAREVHESYATLSHLTDQDAERLVLDALTRFDIHLLRPVDLDEWLGREPGVAARFFRHRLVVDNKIVTDRLDSFEDLLKGAVRQLAPLTDEDLKLLREQIEDTPESHRLNVGIAMLFGFPREMFVGRPNLEKRIGRLQRLLVDIHGDYNDWVFALARTKAGEICDSAEALWVPAIARMLPIQFLNYVVRECLTVALTGSVMTGILDRLSKAPLLEDDDARLRQAQSDVEAVWGRYLSGDFGQMVGDADDLALKHRIIGQALTGITTQQELGQALAFGAGVLKPTMFAAADALRETCKHKTTVVLTGGGGIDSADGLQRFVETLRGLDALTRPPRDQV